MVKIVLSFIFITSAMFGSMIDEKIKSFVGEKNFYSTKKIINILLGDKKQYYRSNGSIKVVKLLKVLKKNGFIKLDLERVNTINITFTTQGNSLLFLKIINNVLNSMGFNFYITKRAIKSDDSFSWEIQMNTEYLVDPVVLADELKKYGCFITDIKKEDRSNWHYFISTTNAKIASKKISPNTSYRLNRPIKSYWLGLDDTLHTLHIISFSSNSWHPYIVFYDHALKILHVYSNDGIKKSLKLNIPKNTKYISIDDKYTLNNIRSGLKIYGK